MNLVELDQALRKLRLSGPDSSRGRTARQPPARAVSLRWKFLVGPLKYYL